MRESPDARASAIIDVVIDLLQSEGYEAVQVRTVARRARISLATMYKLFGTRNALIVAAVERWMEANAYAALTMPEADESPFDTMVRVLRTVFEPWLKQPRMLEAFHWARTSPGGERLDKQGLAAVRPIIDAALADPDLDPHYLSDVGLIHGYVTRAAIAQFANGEIAISDILPILERTLFRLTTDNRIENARVRPPRASATGRSRAAKPRRVATGNRSRSA